MIRLIRTLAWLERNWETCLIVGGLIASLIGLAATVRPGCDF